MKNGSVFLGGLLTLTLANVITAGLCASHPPAAAPDPVVPAPVPVEVLRLHAWSRSAMPLPLPCGRWSAPPRPVPHPGNSAFEDPLPEAW